jgi:hypothetical protein
MDVLSNLPFLVIGLLGLALCAGSRRPPLAMAWRSMFAGVALVGLGSACYHWAPGDARLVWDRLPMTVVLVALFVALLGEHVGRSVDRLTFAAALATGAASVLWWQWTGDLRWYAGLKFSLLAGIAAMLCLFEARFTHRRWLFAGLLLYALAKLAESHDLAVFLATGQTLSGHTAKHLLAAAALACVLVMLWRRTPVRRLH